MCDTFVALGNSTLDGKVLFAKNSDRDPNEAHELILVPKMKHEPESTVKCTYIEVPQVEETYGILLAKPFWIWGAEMGSNEFGVTIGNEAVFTKDPAGKEPGLIGMDLLRLALERSKTAYEALKWITELIEKFGQSGNCGFSHALYYQNSYLICDPDEAWVLETSGKEWAAEKVKDVRSISNGLTIEKQWDLASPNLVAHALEKGWCKDAREFNFRTCYSEPIYTTFGDCRHRQSCTTNLLNASKGKIIPAEMMSILRSHGNHDEADWSPERGIVGSEVCMHFGWGPIRFNQTTGSLVSKIDRSGSVHWVTGTSAPCTSLFKPVWMDSGIPDIGPSPTGIFDEKTLFWSHETVHRAVLKDYAERIRGIKQDQLEFEGEMMREVDENLTSSLNRRKTVSSKYFQQAAEMEALWKTRLEQAKPGRQNGWLYRSAWEKTNLEANMK